MPEEKKDVKGLSFEDALQRLEAIVRQLESGEAPLRESISLYEEAQALKQHCEKELETAERKITRLQLDKNGETPVDEVPFEA